jgi:hypothetical protein
MTVVYGGADRPLQTLKEVTGYQTVLDTQDDQCAE